MSDIAVVHYVRLFYKMEKKVIFIFICVGVLAISHFIIELMNYVVDLFRGNDVCVCVCVLFGFLL